MFAACPIVTALARTTGFGSTGRPLTKTRSDERVSRMANPLIPGCEPARNCALATNYTQNQVDVKTGQAKKLGSAHTLLPSPHVFALKSRGVFSKTPVASFCAFDLRRA